MVSLNVFWYGNGLKHFKEGDIDWEGDTIKVALVQAGYTPNQGTHEFFDTHITNEASGSGYTAGGETLTGRVLSYDNSTLRVVLDGNDVEWDPASISAQYAIIYVDGTAGSADFLIGYGDAGSEETSDNARFAVEWHDDGILRTTATAQ